MRRGVPLSPFVFGRYVLLLSLFKNDFMHGFCILDYYFAVPAHYYFAVPALLSKCSRHGW